MQTALISFAHLIKKTLRKAAKTPGNPYTKKTLMGFAAWLEIFGFLQRTHVLALSISWLELKSTGGRLELRLPPGAQGGYPTAAP